MTDLSKLTENEKRELVLAILADQEAFDILGHMMRVKRIELALREAERASCLR